MTRKPLVVGNWKMELSHKAEVALAKSLHQGIEKLGPIAEVVVCPSFPSLSAVSEMVKKNASVAVGAQDVHWEEKGAFTGEVSVMQISAFAKWCIVGHSEQRAMTNVSDEIVLQKANLLLRHGITPIVCIGETEEEKNADKAVEKISSQVEVIVSQLNRVALVKTIIAYEPIWAIGSGIVPDADAAAEIVLLIRKRIAARFDQEIAGRVRILYGGSVLAENAGEYVGDPGADGVLVGGASVHTGKFLDIIKAVQSKF